jgi:large subunit ribosomal protein L18
MHEKPNRPRLSVFRSLKNIYCQVIDDRQGSTLASASSRDKDLRGEIVGLTKMEVAAKIGLAIAARAKSAGVSQVAFDRGSFKFHGRVKALAEAAREGGLEF